MYISLDFIIFYNPYKLQHDKFLRQIESLTQISLFLLYIVYPILITM